ncbi:MAG: hypothetical protein LBN23_04280, partial [Paludibacter sp.]|nr:hypothetical protein [Paludibacter sp.]
MKRIVCLTIIFIAIAVNAQTLNYEQKWKEIQTAAEKGEVKSLLPKVNDIFAQAKKDGKGDEIVRSLIMQQQILQQTQEDSDHDAYKLVIGNFEENLLGFKNLTGLETTRAVLQSLLAKIYENYAQNTQWQRRNITELETPPADIAEWSTRQLMQKSFELYIQSVETRLIASLQAEKTENWKNILTSDEDIELFPTLYDVLTMRIVNFANINEKQYLDSENSGASIAFLALLINFHSADTNKSALLNYTLKLLEITVTDKAQQAEAIQNLADEYRSEPFAAYLYYCAAKIYAENDDKKRAYENCKNAVETHGSTSKNKWAVNITSLMQELQQQNIQIRIDETSLPNAPIAVNITHTNIEKVYYRVTKITETIVNNELKQIKSSQPVLSSFWLLKSFDDLTAHSTFVKLDALPAGKYCLEVANNADFTKAKQGNEKTMESVDFEVNNWTFVNLSQSDYQLVDRKTGKPLSDKLLRIFKQEYRNNTFSEQPNITTDKNGIFATNKTSNEYGNYYVYNPETKSYLHLGYNYYRDYQHNYEQQTVTDIFTDRAIYRPGQTVYFKAIYYKKDKYKTETVKNMSRPFLLLNPNGEKISEIMLTTNDFGSVFGEFILPTNGLTGVYTIVSSFNGAARSGKNIRVEEYKRPKFEVIMDSLRGEFVLDKEVKTAGKATSYAGAAISEAKVVWRVERQEIFPYYRWWYPPVSNPEAIANGETATDGEGKFSVNFVAKPQTAAVETDNYPSLQKEYRTYTYAIYVDVTDINGETHSTQQSVSIGDLPKKLELQIPEKSLQKDFTKIGIKSINLNDVPEHSKGQIVVTQFIAPNRIILPNKTNPYNPYSRYSPQKQTDNSYQIYDYAEFTKYFPHLPYSQDETNPQNWKRGKTQTFDFDTEKSENVNVETHGGASLPKGFYQIEAYTLFNTDTIKTQKIIEILDDKTLKSTDNVFFFASANKTS